MWARRAFRRWARAAARPLTGDDPDALAGLDRLLAGKRVVYLGESEHFTHEKYAYRRALLRALVRRGWHVIGEELGWSDGRRVHRYLTDGDEAWLDRVSGYGYRGAHREDRDDTPTGALREAWFANPRERFREHQCRLAREIRALSTKPPRFFGFDVDYHASVGYEDVHTALAVADQSAVTQSLREAFAMVPGESLAEEIQRLAGAVHQMEASSAALITVLGADRAREVRRTAATLLASHRYVAAAHFVADLQELRPAMALREDLMLEHVQHVLAEEGPTAKIVLMGQDLHLARDDRRIDVPAGSIGPGGGLRPSVGTRLADQLGDELLVVWMLDNGRRAPRGALNRALAAVGDHFLLPTRSNDPGAALLRTRQPIRIMAAHTVRAVPADQADLIYFRTSVTPIG